MSAIAAVPVSTGRTGSFEEHHDELRDTVPSELSSPPSTSAPGSPHLFISNNLNNSQDYRSSRSPTRSSIDSSSNSNFTDQTPRERSKSRGRMASMLHKIQEGFHNRPSSRDRSGGANSVVDDRSSVATGATEREGRGRSTKQDDTHIISTGRGGAGNIRSQSRAREVEVEHAGEEEARERSRERSRERGALGGRGGAGNWRALSQDPAKRAKDTEEERKFQAAEKAAHEKRAQEDAKHVHSHGRGGAGNIGR